MKWKSKTNLDGDNRIIRRFLFIPKTLQEQTRWLELARIKQVFVNGILNDYWRDIEWVDQDVHMSCSKLVCPQCGR